MLLYRKPEVAPGQRKWKRLQKLCSCILRLTPDASLALRLGVSSVRIGKGVLHVSR